MRTHVLYFYQKIKCLDSDDLKSADILTQSSPLVASVDKAIRKNNERLSAKLRPFELQQDRLLSLIQNADYLGIQVLDIEFTEEIDLELRDELNEALLTNDKFYINRMLSMILKNGHDIFAISYLENGRTFRITKFAVAEIPAEINELASLAFSLPIELATGIKNIPVERM
ncbi:hypothetical protein N7988_28110 (plasmid) [Bacillus cereus]|uniref:hypothetical protein n=1 Tax=Bacillus cereus TaxID=1396 RepID=UPI0021CB99BF|nr:hypothetical protein [Bacillus cereus]MCU7756895.1 hypothetical protein [Bacillus cereus]MDC7752535.1 hypothetical protein [Bacillus cereus]MEB8704650.1 hypothetical protein [Bacillus cereus]UXP17377.1 hypothetical protein N7988_28110 [Bacillus cereus]